MNEWKFIYIAQKKLPHKTLHVHSALMYVSDSALTYMTVWDSALTYDSLWQCTHVCLTVCWHNYDSLWQCTHVWQCTHIIMTVWQCTHVCQWQCTHIISLWQCTHVQQSIQGNSCTHHPLGDPQSFSWGMPTNKKHTRCDDLDLVFRSQQGVSKQ